MDRMALLILRQMGMYLMSGAVSVERTEQFLLLMKTVIFIMMVPMVAHLTAMMI